MDHFITFVIAFAGASLAFALRSRSLIEQIRASRSDAERCASRFREDHRWLVVVAAEIDDALTAHAERSNAAILEALRASARKGASFTIEQIDVLRPADVGRARQWHMPGLANAPSERFFYQRVEKTVDHAAAHLERYPELARSVSQDPFAAARQCGLVAPPDAGPAMDATEHVRWLAEHEIGKSEAARRERDHSSRARRVHSTVRVLRSVGARVAETRPESNDASRDASTTDNDE